MTVIAGFVFRRGDDRRPLDVMKRPPPPPPSPFTSGFDFVVVFDGTRSRNIKAQPGNDDKDVPPRVHWRMAHNFNSGNVK